MNKDTLGGIGKRIKGELQDLKGDITGNPADDLKGKANKIAGEVQESYGDLKDQARADDRRDPL
jgi:uncharacterized protein YjbJ (UPF0337 family)